MMVAWLAQTMLFAAMKPTAEVLAQYQTVIGLEIHIQLQTQTKVFASESMSFGEDPNSSVSAVTYAHPGTLPNPNLACIDQMLRLGLALGCEINPYSYFDRKNYFYPDLPKGYQVTQDQAPLCLKGTVEVPMPDGSSFSVHLDRIHLEEDAGKSIHDQDPHYTLVDLNRAGTGLAEMVTNPDLRSPEQAGAMLSEVRRIVRYLGVSDANMERGNLRCDANVSVMLKDATEYGTRVEVKNLNSINFLQRAIQYEVERQVGLIESGGRVQQQTRLWDARQQKTYAMRDKETAQDYRYFPEPDMLPIVVSEEKKEEIRVSLPELPVSRFHQYVDKMGIGVNEAMTLIEDLPFATYFEQLADRVGEGKVAANWLLGPVRTYLNEHDIEVSDYPVTQENLAKLIALVSGDKVSFTVARDQLLPACLEAPQADPNILAEKMGLLAGTDQDELLVAMQQLMERMPDEVKRYRQGKKNLAGFFVGQMMKEFKGKADPKAVNRVVRQELEKDS